MAGFLGALASLAAPIASKAIGGTAGQLVGAGLGAFGVGSQNQLSYNQQLALQQQGQQWQEHIIDKQNAWNSAVEQAKRYREAGINPVLALGNGSAGIVSAGGSSGVNSAHPSVDAAQLGTQYKQLEQRDRELDSVTELNASEASAAKASAAKSEEERKTEVALRALRVAGALGDVQKTRIGNRILQMEEQYLSDTYEDRVTVLSEQAKQEIERTSQMIAQTTIQKFESEHVSRRFKAELAKIQSEIALNYQHVQLAICEGRAADAAAAGARARAQLDRLEGYTKMYSKSQLEHLRKATVDSVVAAAKQQGSNASWADVNNAIGAFTNAFIGVGAASVGLGRAGGVLKSASKGIKGAVSSPPSGN